MSIMRTIDQSHQYLVEKDSKTAVSKTGLRRLVTSGRIPSVKVGSKYLINLEVLEKYLSASNTEVASIQKTKD